MKGRNRQCSSKLALLSSRWFLACAWLLSGPWLMAHGDLHGQIEELTPQILQKPGQGSFTSNGRNCTALMAVWRRRRPIMRGPASWLQHCQTWHSAGDRRSSRRENWERPWRHLTGSFWRIPGMCLPMWPGPQPASGPKPSGPPLRTTKSAYLSLC